MLLLYWVYYGKNLIYIDKNYSFIFFFWDWMFGMYQEEIEKVVYGIFSKDYVDGDFVDVVFYYYEYLFRFMWFICFWKNCFKVLVMLLDYWLEDIDVDFFVLVFFELIVRN